MSNCIPINSVYDATMFNVRKLCLVLIISFVSGQCKSERDFFTGEPSTLESAEDFVDPYSFYYDKIVQNEVAPSQLSQRLRIDGASESDAEDCITCKAELHLCKISLRNRPKLTDVADELFSRRFVNTLLSRANLKQNGAAFTGHVELDATEAQLEALRNFAEGKSTIREIDMTLNRIMKKPPDEDIFETNEWLYDILSSFVALVFSILDYVLDNKNIFIPTLCTLYIVRQLNRMKYNLWMVIPIVITMILVLSFLITWWRLVQEAEIKHSTLQMKHLKMPIHCEPEKMSIWDKFATYFSSTDECHKYHEAMMKTPFLEVTPAQALSHMVAHLIYEPFVTSGKALKSFLDHATADMSWFTAALLQIIVIGSFLPLVVLGIILLAGGSLGFGGFGFLSLLRLKGPERTDVNANLHSLEPPRTELDEPRKSRKLALENKSAEDKKPEKQAMPLKLSTPKNDGSGDRDRTNSESEDESLKMNPEASEAKGSGDHALS